VQETQGEHIILVLTSAKRPQQHGWRINLEEADDLMRAPTALFDLARSSSTPHIKQFDIEDNALRRSDARSRAGILLR
jgi:hypothetical protein